jgi:Domain of unknown function (DUF1707)/Cell wall-active antibiotics response 4TMS YvqF
MSQPAIRASDADRERAVELLRRHSVDGRLTLEEFAERMGLAYEAKTQDELEQLTRDLPEQAAVPPARRRKPTRWIVSVMGGVNRRGRFRLGARTYAVSIMGGMNVDLRQAELEEPEVTITVVSIMGGANIIVPEGVDVELTGIAIMGGKGYRPGKQPPPPGAPLVRVRVVSLMGGVSVITKRGTT